MQRIEDNLHGEEGLTAEDIELILSIFPDDLRKAVLARLSEMAGKEPAGGNYPASGRTKARSSLQGSKALEEIMNELPPEYAPALKAAVESREGVRNHGGKPEPESKGETS